MKRSIISAAVLAALSGSPFALVSSVHAAEAASPHTLTGNMMLTSDYRFRGISQSFKKPAIQGGIDYSHSSGFYLGTWASSVSGNQYPNGSSLEWDFYGGYKLELAKELTLDIGNLYYYYPGAYYNGITPKTKFDNNEIYLGLSYKWLSAKLSYATTDYFGVNKDSYNGASNIDSTDSIAANGNSRGSTYIELNAAYPLTEKLTLNAHIGDTRVRHYGKLNYTDWKLGVSYDLNGWALGLNYVDTDKNKFYYSAPISNTANTKRLDKSTVVLSIGKTF